MEHENVESPEKEPDSSGKVEPQVLLWRWTVVVAIIGLFLSVATFFAGRYYESQQWEKQVEHWRTEKEYLKRQLEQAETALEYSTEPNCALQFVSASMIESTTPHFLLKNLGPGRLDDVWLKETVFLIDSGGVHECPDLPHFEYFYYCGHIASMGPLYVGDSKRIDLPPCWSRPFDLFFQKFSGKLVSRFRLTGTALASPEFRKDFLFVIDRSRHEYVSPDEYIGGKDLVDSTIAYARRGPRSIIRWVLFGDFHDFFRNPPKFFYQPDGRKYVPWHGPGPPPVSPATMPIYLSRYSVLPAEGGSAKLIWDCDELGPIAKMFECQPGVW